MIGSIWSPPEDPEAPFRDLQATLTRIRERDAWNAQFGYQPGRYEFRVA